MNRLNIVACATAILTGVGVAATAEAGQLVQTDPAYAGTHKSESYRGHPVFQGRSAAASRLNSRHRGHDPIYGWGPVSGGGGGGGH